MRESLIVYEAMNYQAITSASEPTDTVNASSVSAQRRESVREGARAIIKTILHPDGKGGRGSGVTCDKCGGLVIRGDWDGELKCVQCSKRVYQEPEVGFCKEFGCRTQTKGAYCSMHALIRGFQSAVDSVSEEGGTVVKDNKCLGRYCRKPPMPGESYCESHMVESAAHVVQETIMNGHTPQKPAMKTKVLVPAEMRFTVGRQAEDWEAFVEAWQQQYRGFELDCVTSSKDDEAMLNVWLRPIEEKADES